MCPGGGEEGEGEDEGEGEEEGREGWKTRDTSHQIMQLPKI